MCVAIYKPKGVNIPSKDELYNCFLRNKDGAGYAFFRNDMIHIKKGYMSFNDFYEAFTKENFNAYENIFIHFRIATHGLVDGGNTHPFPIINDFTKMRETNLDYHGKCLIHNGVFHYDYDQIYAYSNIISDTMLFSKLLFDQINKSQYMEKDIKNLNLEESVARSFTEKNNLMLIHQINQQLNFSKIAIMNEDGSVDKFGTWINHNGVYYSNSSYEGYQTKWNYVYKSGDYTTYSYNDPNFAYRSKEFFQNFFSRKKDRYYADYCDYCGKYKQNCTEVGEENVCKQCLKEYDMHYCKKCHTWLDRKVMYKHNVCIDCYKKKHIAGLLTN